MIDNIDMEILRFVQDDLPLESRPYAAISEKLGISENDICARLRRFNDSGLIRRFGAILSHAKAGYRANAMVIWRVDETNLDNTASILLDCDSVSHLYARPPKDNWPYNLYSMIHAHNYYELTKMIDCLAGKIGNMCEEYRVLKSVREFKKSSMQYFSGD